ncbi:prephenate dehydrogenase [Fretibacterium fastidiosum]|uniref:Prephenate dehydrogenase n=1 Tax=Fretibacterium fastidiosum TaxID=651822 RepID=A0AB94IXL5_9BACT|nr:prephenate dehydrogenase/arogenate dehydrogenase family protein [Fretibacterium fastidiosum]CBL28512.1 Prephenate dehydrogenase [Fretibacterium fastidiosum]
MNVGIVGLGLIGGSMAKSVKTRTLHTVWGADIDRETMTLARLCGAIDGPLTDENLADCDLLLLALAPRSVVGWVQEHAKGISRKTVVIDLCGIKRAVCRELAPLARQHGFTYVGGHPMAGLERSGFVNAQPDLFAGSSMILMRGPDTDIQLLDRLKAFFTDVGFASLTFTTPEEHDRIIAYTSQLAHVVSSAYVRSPEALERRGFSAGSFRDMTRVARLDEILWTELLMDNRDFLVGQIETLIDNLNGYLDALKSDDAARLRALLKEGREKKAQAGGN